MVMYRNRKIQLYPQMNISCEEGRTIFEKLNTKVVYKVSGRINIKCLIKHLCCLKGTLSTSIVYNFRNTKTKMSLKRSSLQLK